MNTESIFLNSCLKMKGYAQELMQAFTSEVHKRNCNLVVSYTDAEGNEKATKFDSDLGFKLMRTYLTPEGRNMNEYRRRNT